MTHDEGDLELLLFAEVQDVLGIEGFQKMGGEVEAPDQLRAPGL